MATANNTELERLKKEWENVLARIPKVLLSSEPETMVDKLAPVFHDLDGQLSRHQSSEICEPPKAATDRQPSATATPEQFTAAQRLLDRMSEEVRMTSQTLTTGALELGWLCECAQAPQALLMQLVECKACKRCVLRRRAAAHRAKCVIAPPKQSVSDQLPSSSYPGKAAAAGLQATGLGMPAAAVSQGQAQDAKGKGGLPKVPKPSKSGGSKSVSARNGGSAADAAAAAVAAAGGLRPTKLSKVTFPAASASPSTMQDASTGPSDSYSIVEAFMNFQSDVLSFPSSVRRKRSSVPVRRKRTITAGKGKKDPAGEPPAKRQKAAGGAAKQQQQNGAAAAPPVAPQAMHAPAGTMPVRPMGAPAAGVPAPAAMPVQAHMGPAPTPAPVPGMMPTAAAAAPGTLPQPQQPAPGMMPVRPVYPPPVTLPGTQGMAAPASPGQFMPVPTYPGFAPVTSSAMPQSPAAPIPQWTGQPAQQPNNTMNMAPAGKQATSMPNQMHTNTSSLPTPVLATSVLRGRALAALGAAAQRTTQPGQPGASSANTMVPQSAMPSTMVPQSATGMPQGMVPQPMMMVPQSATGMAQVSVQQQQQQPTQQPQPQPGMVPQSVPGMVPQQQYQAPQPQMVPQGMVPQQPYPGTYMQGMVPQQQQPYQMTMPATTQQQPAQTYMQPQPMAPTSYVPQQVMVPPANTQYS